METVDELEIMLNSLNSCSPYDLEDLNKDETFLNSPFNLFHLNIRSSDRNFNLLLSLLATMKVKFSVIVLTETWLKDKSHASNIPGYVAYHSIRPNDKGYGGVSIYIKNELQSSEIVEFSINTDIFESVGAKISIRNKIINIIGIYKPPRSPLDQFNGQFFDKLSILPANEMNFLTGDFNVNLMQSNPSSANLDFREKFSSYFYHPLINIPTRTTETSSTCIDNIFTNTLEQTTSGTIECIISDHHGVISTIPIQFNQPHDNFEFKFRDNSIENIQKLRQDLIKELTLFPHYNQFNMNDQLTIFLDILMESYNKNCPIRTKIISQKQIEAPWISAQLKRAINEKHRLHKLSKNDQSIVSRFKLFSKQLRDTIENARRAYYRRKFQISEKDPKATWKIINSLIKPITKRNLYKLKEEGVEIKDSEEIAKIFNSHFISVAPDLAAKIPITDADPLHHVGHHERSFQFYDCTPQEIESIIRSLKSKRCAPQEIPVSILKQVVDIISPIISQLVNSSVSDGSFPKALKVARIVPIHKSGPKSNKKNYRPISILPTLSKIFEKAIHKRITNFFVKFNLLYSDQYGFQSKKSTTDAIIKFTDQCYDIIDNKEKLLSIYLDFSKAFDTVDHKILCKKLERYGIRGHINKWFESYLEKREQYVQISDQKSSTKISTCGVPQGSVLGPLLFLIYINDMHKCSQLKFIHFADDSTAYSSHNNLHELVPLVNIELEKIDRWICANKLSLNTDKTSFMIFSNTTTQNTPSVRIRNTIIEQCHKQKFLGVIIDDKLNYKEHINSISNRVKRMNGLLWKLSFCIPRKISRKIYNSLIYPHLIYANEVWGKSSQVALSRLDRLVSTAQKYASDTSTNNNPSSKLLNLNQIHELFCMTRFYKYYVQKSNPYFFEKFRNQLTTHNINTRFSANNNFNTPVIHLERTKSSFFYASHQYWNKLPNQVRNCSRLSSFKKHLRNYLTSR